MSSIQNGLKGITIASLYLFLVSDFDSHIDGVSMTMISLRESLYSFIYLVNGDVTESDSCIKARIPWIADDPCLFTDCS